MMALSGRLILVAVAASTIIGAAASPRHTVPFIADDYPGALAQARAKKLPIFVEAWAPW